MSPTLEEIEAAIMHPAFSHARSGDGCWRDLVWIYHTNNASPTGVTLVISADKSVAEPLLRAKRATSPLSPSERR
jgi:hypothetical protein